MITDRCYTVPSHHGPACYDPAGTAGESGPLCACRALGKEAWHLAKHTARLGTINVLHKAVIQTRTVISYSSRAAPTGFTHAYTWRCTLGRPVWPQRCTVDHSIPAAATTVTPQVHPSIVVDATRPKYATS